MADDTANGAGTVREYADAITAQLGERVTNLNRRQTDFEAEMRGGLRQIETSLSSFANETRNSIANLTTTMSDRARPQWQALGVALAFAGMLGGLAYMPIREATNDLKASVALLADRMVTRQEMDWRSARAAEDRDRTNAAITELRSLSVGRSEWTERNRARDQEVAELSRRIEEIRAALGSQYTTRDVLLELQEEIKDLRNRPPGT